MKTLAKITCLTLTLVMLAGAATAAESNRIATCDFQKVMEGYHRARQAKGAFDTARADLQKKFQTRVEEFEKMKREYNRLNDAVKDISISPAEREIREKRALEKFKEVNDEKQLIDATFGAADEQMKLKWERALEELEEIINSAIKARAKAAGYTIVLNTTKDKLRILPLLVLYTSGENDITDDILKELNAAAPAEKNSSAAGK